MNRDSALAAGEMATSEAALRPLETVPIRPKLCAKSPVSRGSQFLTSLVTRNCPAKCIWLGLASYRYQSRS